tara:strand:+ start:8849 stop:9538 length:690 start_codon:yes stop_codon:yes gene_type:complete
MQEKTLKHNFKAVLFDLDGTLIDTIHDIKKALNNVFEKYNIPSINTEEVRKFISYGSKKILETHLYNHPDIDTSNLDINKIINEVIEYYSNHMDDHSEIFKNTENVINFLDTNNIKWGIVTNKYEKLTKELIAKYNIFKNCSCVVGQDTAANPKPHPDPVLYALEQLDMKAQDCVFLGDSINDITAGKYAGTFTAVALYGYIGNPEEASAWNADFYMKDISEIIKLFDI